MADQLARGLFNNFGPSEHPFQSPNGMEDNLRRIDDLLAPCALGPPAAAGTALPVDPLPGSLAMFSDGTFAVWNLGGWVTYPAAWGLAVALSDGSDIYLGTGSSWLSLRLTLGLTALEAAQTNGVVGFETLAAMEASLAYPEGTVGWVLNDAVAANNLVYRKVGASGSGSWEVGSDSLLSQLLATVTTAALVADASNNFAFGAESLGRFSGPGLSGASDNTTIGYQAGGSLVGGDRNTDIGRAAGRANVNGSDNVRVGYAAGFLKAAGSENTMLGSGAAGNSAVAVDRVTAVGRNALSNVAVNDATAVGAGAGNNLTTGVRFTAIGTSAGTSHTTQDGCTFVGWGAGVGAGQTYTHHNQTALGADTYCNWENQVTLGNNDVSELRLFGDVFARQYAFADVIIGQGAGNRDTTAGSGARVVIGYQAGVASLGANDSLSVIIGYLACNAASQNRAWIAIGAKAGENAQNTIDCSVIGDQAGRWLGRHQPLSWDVPNDETHIKSAGSDVTQGLALPANIVGATGFGKNALRYNTIGQNNTGIGDSALGFTTTGGQNVGVGYVCGEGNVIGSRNSWLGQGIRVYVYSGDDNAQVGYGIGEGIGSFGTWLTGGSRNSNVGTQSLHKWRGDNVAALGYRAFYSMNAGAGGDVGIGYRAGHSVVTGGDNLFIGADAGNHGSQATNVQNSMALGAGTWTTANNQVVIGNTSITQTLLRGKVGVNGTPNSQLQASADLADFAITGTYAQIEATGSTSAAKRTALGYHTTLNLGFVQALTNAVGYNPFIVNPMGGNVGVGMTAAPTARLHLPAGAAAAGGAPLKLTSGTNLTTPENGTLEFNGTNLFFTAGGTRRTIDWT